MLWRPSVSELLRFGCGGCAVVVRCRRVIASVARRRCVLPLLVVVVVCRSEAFAAIVFWLA